MSKLMEQDERFRRAADVEAETPITAGPPILKKRWANKVSIVDMTGSDRRAGREISDLDVERPIRRG